MGGAVFASRRDVNFMSNWLDLKDNPRLRSVYERRGQILRCIREFFWQRNFVETDVPTALRYPGQEPYLNPVPLTFHDPLGRPQPLYLQTSPEFSLKKLLAAGFSPIFSLTRSFRDYEEFGRTHNTEFTLLEWYRAPGVYQDFMEDMEALFKYVGAKLGCTTLRCQENSVSLQQSWQRRSMKELWSQYIGINLDNYLEFEPLRVIAKKRGYTVNESDEYEDIFFKIFLNEIEQHLGFDAPTFVYDYPKRMSSLSRACADDPRYAERVECYIAGLEIANGFGELVDANEQKQRLEVDQALRRKLGKATWPIDPEFIAALGAKTLDTAAGVAMGVDRMVLLFTGAHDLNEVIFQSVADQFENNQQ